MRNKPNEWISIADLMTGVVGVVLLLFVMMAMLANKLESSGSTSARTDAKGKRGQWPPFFSLSEAGGYYFESGRATLSSDFRNSLISDIIPKLSKNIDDYGVDVVEVIGHTDEVPMGGTSNLDKKLVAASNGRFDIGELHSTDNAGLALARAVAVVQILRRDPRLKNVTILPLSAAQMIAPGDRVADGSAAASDQRRRRIEIRLRKSTNQAEANRPGRVP
ncbi:outer membrane protein OmpA-like peptidoglycan-associated protein [Sphingomonas kyeonggiensis]|uniref:hypothetical protein n=1 Tax=Sphingomonas kyeonggiensis TaxID=1268553 RepID=UPI002789F6BA|nr:hypothetical protein [Sphingomonas kyeonggiensis]MDQ0248395.1 outer membrane protein OmpA-like peptidoglycan-associated protein [Sphingomonas kyeonggiensis]